jgi:hypothetical protein
MFQFLFHVFLHPGILITYGTSSNTPMTAEEEDDEDDDDQGVFSSWVHRRARTSTISVMSPKQESRARVSITRWNQLNATVDNTAYVILNIWCYELIVLRALNM